MKNFLRNFDGKLTKILKLAPGGHGLGRVPERLVPESTVTSVCGFCSIGCGLKIHMKDGEALNSSAEPNYPVNRGMACPKGWEALSPLNSPHRGTTPLLREGNGDLSPVDWNTAIKKFCSSFRNILQNHGPESAAFLSTGQISTEEMFFLGSLAKFGMEMVHGDGNTRQCMATAVTAYKQSFGFDAPPYTYADFEESDVLVFVGANPCIAHPILWERVMKNRRNPDIVVVDPRLTETAMQANLHLAPFPQSDLNLFYGIANILFEKKRIDKSFLENHVEDFQDFREHVKKFPLEKICGETGLEKEAILRLAELVGSGKRVSFWWTMGVNQSHEGTRLAQSLINLALITGNIGKPGTGANSITGQCNAMGSRLFSNSTNLLGGHAFDNTEHRAKVARILEISEEKIPRKDSFAYDKILEEISAGRIKALWIIATNTAHSWINRENTKLVLSKLDFLVVQDMYCNTQTVNFAQLYLPAAGWGEKEGTFINSERRIGRIRKVRKAPGKALDDFSIFRLIAEEWGFGNFSKSWDHPEKVFQLMKALSEGQPCDFGGIRDYAHLDQAGGIQWPFPKGRQGDKAKERRLFENKKFFHPNQKARLFFDTPRPLPEVPNKAFPFLLLTGRGSSSQWHTLTRSAQSAVLSKLSPSEVYVDIHPDDAKELEVRTQDLVTVESRRGRLKANAHVTRTIARKQLFIPMHFSEVNLLTFPAFDPHSRQPACKASAVSLSLCKHWEV